MENIIKKISAILLVAFLFTACSGKINPKNQEIDTKVQSQSEETGQKDENPGKTTEKASLDTQKVNKDQLVLGLGLEPEKGFNPIYESSHSRSQIFHSCLLKRDINLNIVNDLADSYTLSDDRKVYNVKLKKGIKFSDGTDLKADDVVFTYNEAKKQSAAGINLVRFVEAKKLDDYTVEIILDKPDISFTSTLASLGIVKSDGYDEDYGQNPIGSGPFKMLEWKKGQELIVEPNEYYYGDKVPFKKISFVFFKDDDAAIAAAKEGVCDIVRVPYTAADMQIDGFHAISLKTIDNRGISLPVEKDTGKLTDKNTLAPNSAIGNNVTSDIAIRKALNIAVDRQEIIDYVLNGQATKATSIADNLPWYNEETSDIKDGDIDTAKKLLDDAGWIEEADGIRQKDGIKAEFDLLYAYQDRENLAVYFSEVAKKIGIKINPIYGDWDFIEPKMYSQAVLFGWGGYDPLDMYYSYDSKFKGYDYYNANFYGNEKVDKYFEEGLSASSLDEFYDKFKLAQWDGEGGFSWKGDCPWVWLVNENHVYLVRDGLKIGEQMIEPHSSSWTLINTVSNWKWTK